jgi:hypothetical protein
MRRPGIAAVRSAPSPGAGIDTASDTGTGPPPIQADDCTRAIWPAILTLKSDGPNPTIAEPLSSSARTSTSTLATSTDSAYRGGCWPASMATTDAASNNAVAVPRRISIRAIGDVLASMCGPRSMSDSCERTRSVRVTNPSRHELHARAAVGGEENTSTFLVTGTGLRFTQTSGVAPTPEPASILLLGTAFAGFAARQWRQRKREQE